MINFSLNFKNKKLILKKNLINPTKSDLIIRVKSCGICGSDLNILKNGSHRVSNGRIMGHEISGEILDQNNKKSKKKNIFLGADIPNKEKKDYAFGHEIDGGFQKYLILKKKFLKKVPHYITTKKIDYKIASLCEPIACCINGFKDMNFKQNKSVIIFGAGPIGQLIAQICIFKKAKEVFLIDQNINRLYLGTKNKKIKKLQNKEFIKIYKGNKKFDYGFVACSSADAQNEILQYMKKKSTVNYFAGIKNNSRLVPIDTNLIHYNEIKVVGSHGSSKADIIKSAKLIINKKLNLKGIITRSYSINYFKRAFKDLKKGICLKAVITP